MRIFGRIHIGLENFFELDLRHFYLCKLLHDDMTIVPPESLKILPNQKMVVMRQIVIALRHLAVGNSFLTLGELFGVSKMMAIRCTWKFVYSLRQIAKHVICWLNDEGMQAFKDSFEKNYGFQNCCGVVDGTHFQIKLPYGEDLTQYYDWKSKISVTMQAICDLKLVSFLDVCCGLPGSIQDTRLMRLS
jgi:hypothetical protein